MVDTTSQFAEFVIAVLGAAAGWERHRIAERTVAGMVQTKARGVKFGRNAAYHRQAEAAMLGLNQATISRLHRNPVE